jgi:hypothetical protein
MKSKFVFEIKRDGTYKARLVACGYSQIHGHDYSKTYSPTAAFKGVCVLLHEVGHHNWEMCTSDIGNAFLESNIDFDIRMSLPVGLEEALHMQKMEARLLKGLYGLKQAGRLWYEKLARLLIEYGFERSIYDPCIFSFHDGLDIVKIACHVDDMLIISNTLEARQRVVTHLEKTLTKVKVFTENIDYLGLDITRDRTKNRVYLKQTKYVNQLAEDLLNGVGTSVYPMKTNQLANGSGEYPPIQDIIGKLRYLVDRTRPDLLYPLAVLSRYMVKPSLEVMKEVNRLVRYINKTKHYHIVLGSKEPIILYGMSDAAFVQDGDCRSQLGFNIFLSTDSGAVYSKTMRDTVISLSSTQPETSGAVEATKEVNWFQGFMESIGIEVNPPTVLFVDNQPTVTLAHDGNHLRRSKHFVVRTAYLKEQVEMNIIDVVHIPGKKNHSDLMTKPLHGELLKVHTFGILGMKMLDV